MIKVMISTINAQSVKSSIHETMSLTSSAERMYTPRKEHKKNFTSPMERKQPRTADQQQLD